jgi:GDPmannose 4,6-dehydratase
MNMKQKTALIIGISGQDGSYLAELLLAKNYRVVGLMPEAAPEGTTNIAQVLDKVRIVTGDLLDIPSLIDAVRSHEPDEVYNLAAQSHAGKSWQLAIETAEVTAVGAQRVFEAIRNTKPDCRIYHASSSEMFGETTGAAQNENTPFAPVNPYGAAKLYAHTIAQIYNRSYGLYIACGILFNHESPRRGLHFITQKVAYGAACAKLGITDSPDLNERAEPIVRGGKLALGNLDAKRDWGFAGDYVEAMWLTLQQNIPATYVIGTGQLRTVRQLCEQAFASAGLDWQQYVVVDPHLKRITESGAAVADATKARNELGWSPRTSFADLISMMVKNQLDRLKKISK